MTGVMDWELVDKNAAIQSEWWRSKAGYVRRTGCGYAAWDYFRPAAGWFPTFEEAAAYVELSSR